MQLRQEPSQRWRGSVDEPLQLAWSQKLKQAMAQFRMTHVQGCSCVCRLGGADYIDGLVGAQPGQQMSQVRCVEPRNAVGAVASWTKWPRWEVRCSSTQSTTT